MADSKAAPDPEKPDSLRLRMRELSESIPATPATVNDNGNSRKTASRDTTDYLGKILGKSPVNVPVN